MRKVKEEEEEEEKGRRNDLCREVLSYPILFYIPWQENLNSMMIIMIITINQLLSFPLSSTVHAK
jgi:hypothetical protein